MEVAETLVMPSPQARQRKLLRSVLARFGSKQSISSSRDSPSNSITSAPCSPDVGRGKTRSIIARDSFLDDDDDDSIDPEDLFKVTNTDDVFVVERSKPRHTRGPRASLGAGENEWDDDSGNEDDDVFSFEEMLHVKAPSSRELRTPKSSDGTPGIDLMSPTSASRRMIKSLPRVFKPSSHEESKSDTEFKPAEILQVPPLVDERHRALLRDISKRFRGSSNKLQQNIEVTDDMKQVEQMIMDKQGKTKLTDALVSEKEDLLVKMHFCSAVAEYELIKDANSKAKRSKGKKIVRMFIVRESMFRLHNIPLQFEQQILVGKRLEYLEPLRLMCLEELATSDSVLKVLYGSKRSLLATSTGSA